MVAGDWAERRVNRTGRAQSIFRAVKLFSVMVAACHCTLVQTHRMYDTKVNPNVNSGLWVTMMCQWRFINSNRTHHSGGGMCIMGEAVLVWAQGV